MSLERDLMDLEESLMRNDDCVHQSDYYTIVALSNDAREIERECDSLKAENDKLTEQCKRLFDKTIELGTEYAQLKESLAESEHSESMAWDRTRKVETENVKLRELVHDMWSDGMCDCDELVASQGQYHCAQCQYHYRERMRDLGVEVD